MSRKRGEFEHRTSIFEGAFRAWSHLGGLSAEDLLTKTENELDPLTNPIINDPRQPNRSGDQVSNSGGNQRRKYPYEQLPRSGLDHPFVRQILLPWLGPNADNEAFQYGLTTLRTWWQHRRKGESGQAIAALGTEKMTGVLEGYTRHFFRLAYSLVVVEKAHPPKRLHNLMKELEKERNRSGRGPRQGHNFPSMMGSNGVSTSQGTQLDPSRGGIPGNIEVPLVVGSNVQTDVSNLYGDPNTTPVVFVSSNGDIQIAMSVEDITCSHCVKIIETVLKGCNGKRSPISGVLDAAADRELKSVLIKIDKASNAKRIAFEAHRNLEMVGYTARPKEMGIVGPGADAKSTKDLGALSTAFEVVATTDAQDVFDWNTPCTCPDNGTVRRDCPRHSQMNKRIFDAFERREQQVTEFMAGCGMNYGIECTCGPSCRCKHCPIHLRGVFAHSNTLIQNENTLQNGQLHSNNVPTSRFNEMGPPASIDLQDVEPISILDNRTRRSLPSPFNATLAQPSQNLEDIMPFNGARNSGRGSIRNSIRNMSVTSETTFGRALSRLSALSIDWDNFEEFDDEATGGSPPYGNAGGSRRSSVHPSYAL